MEINQSISQARMNEEIARSTWQDAFNHRQKREQTSLGNFQLQAPELEAKKDKAKPKAEPQDAFVRSEPTPEPTYKPV
jgi:hypothetical protein